MNIMHESLKGSLEKPFQAMTWTCIVSKMLWCDQQSAWALASRVMSPSSCFHPATSARVVRLAMLLPSYGAQVVVYRKLDWITQSTILAELKNITNEPLV